MVDDWGDTTHYRQHINWIRRARNTKSSYRLGATSALATTLVARNPADSIPKGQVGPHELLTPIPVSRTCFEAWCSTVFRSGKGFFGSHRARTRPHLRPLQQPAAEGRAGAVGRRTGSFPGRPLQEVVTQS